MARLTTTVYVVDPDGRNRPFGPGADLPDWAVTQISNPDVWDGHVPDHLAQPAKGGEGARQGDEVSAQKGGGQAPPRAGKGSGRDAWAAYAAERGVQVDDDASRDDIIDQLTERGLID
jgi:hypothetical protein